MGHPVRGQWDGGSRRCWGTRALHPSARLLAQTMPCLARPAKWDPGELERGDGPQLTPGQPSLP